MNRICGVRTATFGITKVSQAGELHGIHQDIGSGRLFIVKPYGRTAV